MRELDKEFRSKAKLAKLAYKDKVEEKLKVGNAKDAWGSTVSVCVEEGDVISCFF